MDPESLVIAALVVGALLTVPTLHLVTYRREARKVPEEFGLTPVLEDHRFFKSRGRLTLYDSFIVCRGFSIANEYLCIPYRRINRIGVGTIPGRIYVSIAYMDEAGLKTTTLLDGVGSRKIVKALQERIAPVAVVKTTGTD